MKMPFPYELYPKAKETHCLNLPEISVSRPPFPGSIRTADGCFWGWRDNNSYVSTHKTDKVCTADGKCYNYNDVFVDEVDPGYSNTCGQTCYAACECNTSNGWYPTCQGTDCYKVVDTRYAGKPNAASASRSISDVASISASGANSGISASAAAKSGIKTASAAGNYTVSAASAAVATAGATSGISTMASGATTCYKKKTCSEGGYFDSEPAGQACTSVNYNGLTCYKDCQDKCGDGNAYYTISLENNPYGSSWDPIVNLNWDSKKSDPCVIDGTKGSMEAKFEIWCPTDCTGPSLQSGDATVDIDITHPGDYTIPSNGNAWCPSGTSSPDILWNGCIINAGSCNPMNQDCKSVTRVNNTNWVAETTQGAKFHYTLTTKPVYYDCNGTLNGTWVEWDNSDNPEMLYHCCCPTRLDKYDSSCCTLDSECPDGYYEDEPNSSYFEYKTSANGNCYKVTGCAAGYTPVSTSSGYTSITTSGTTYDYHGFVCEKDSDEGYFNAQFRIRFNGMEEIRAFALGTKAKLYAYNNKTDEEKEELIDLGRYAIENGQISLDDLITVADNNGYNHALISTISIPYPSSDTEIDVEITGGTNSFARVECNTPVAVSGLSPILEETGDGWYPFVPDGSNADKIIDMLCKIKTPSTWALKLVQNEGAYQYIETSLLSDTGASLDDFYRIKKFSNGSFAGGRRLPTGYTPSIIDITLNNKSTNQSTTGSYMFNNANNNNCLADYCPNETTVLTSATGYSKGVLKVLTHDFNSAVFKIGNDEIYNGNRDIYCPVTAITNQEAITCGFKDKISMSLERKLSDIIYTNDTEDLDVKFIVPMSSVSTCPDGWFESRPDARCFTYETKGMCYRATGCRSDTRECGPKGYLTSNGITCYTDFGEETTPTKKCECKLTVKYHSSDMYYTDVTFAVSLSGTTCKSNQDEFTVEFPGIGQGGTSTCPNASITDHLTLSKLYVGVTNNYHIISGSGCHFMDVNQPGHKSYIVKINGVQASAAGGSSFKATDGSKCYLSYDGNF